MRVGLSFLQRTKCSFVRSIDIMFLAYFRSREGWRGDILSIAMKSQHNKAVLRSVISISEYDCECEFGGASK